MPFIDLIRSSLLVDEIFHGIVALPFAYYVYRRTEDKKLFFLVLLMTYVIDVDHLVDYFAYYGFHFSISDFFGLDYFRESGKAYVIFHAWEWLVILIYFARKYGIRSNWSMVLAAYMPHLLYDAVGVGSFLFYSITYRITQGFVIP